MVYFVFVQKTANGWCPVVDPATGFPYFNDIHKAREAYNAEVVNDFQVRIVEGQVVGWHRDSPIWPVTTE